MLGARERGQSDARWSWAEATTRPRAAPSPRRSPARRSGDQRHRRPVRAWTRWRWPAATRPWPARSCSTSSNPLDFSTGELRADRLQHRQRRRAAPARLPGRPDRQGPQHRQRQRDGRADLVPGAHTIFVAGNDATAKRGRDRPAAASSAGRRPSVLDLGGIEAPRGGWRCTCRCGCRSCAPSTATWPSTSTSYRWPDGLVVRKLMTDAYDVIVVGGGHNGLVAAGYLARAGRRVLVLRAPRHGRRRGGLRAPVRPGLHGHLPVVCGEPAARATWCATCGWPSTATTSTRRARTSRRAATAATCAARRPAGGARRSASSRPATPTRTSAGRPGSAGLGAAGRPAAARDPAEARLEAARGDLLGQAAARAASCARSTSARRST